MRIGYSLGSLLSVREVLDCAKMLRGTDADTVWIPETWGMECFSMLGSVSQAVDCKIGSSIINVYSRSPAAIAMGAATIDTISNGRLILGLGTSSPPIIEGFHGSKFEGPVPRMREYMEIIRMALSRQRIRHSGATFQLDGFTLLIKPPREAIPMYVAAVNKQMVKLAWEAADGVIFYLRPLGELRETVSRMQRGRRIDVTCQIITSVAEDADAAITRARKTLAFYISVGGIYRKFLEENGFRSETGNIFDEYARTGLASNYELVTNGMLDSLVIAGTPADCAAKLARFQSAGVDMPIIQFNPVGDVRESFGLLVQTFSGRQR